MDDYSFGNYIFRLRTKSGLSQAELAEELGVTGKAVISDDTQMTLFTANEIPAGETRQVRNSSVLYMKT